MGERLNRGGYLTYVIIGMSTILFATASRAADFHSAWPTSIERTWVGPEYYACRLQDWRIREGRLECIESGENKPLRVVHLLTAELSDEPGEMTMSVLTGPIERGKDGTADSWCGFLLGAGGKHIDYRLTALVHHRPAEDGGLVAVLDGTGRVMFRDNEHRSGECGAWGIDGALEPDELAEIEPTARKGNGFDGKSHDAVELRLTARPAGERYTLTLSAHNPVNGDLISRVTLENIDPRLVDGGVGLVSSRGPTDSHLGHWFRDWRLSGSKVTVHEEREFGPIFCSQYTLSRGTLKMTAQLPPLGQQDTPTAELQIQTADGQWQTVTTASLVEHSYTIPFRVENWDSRRSVPYRVVYELKTGADSTRTCYWKGTIRQEPINRDEFVLAAFTCARHYTGGLRWNHNGIWFPHNEIVAAIEHHKPDFLFFSGDQVYESDLTGAQRSPLDKAILDYLDKWSRWCWSFRDLARDTPCICIPDDHDVYHGNLWGAGGRHAKRQDDGGYCMPAEFVNVVERTQTSHLPDPYDPTPVEQGICVYYTHIEYAGMSLAVIEDRKFKSSATVALPKGNVVNGWFQNPDFDPVVLADIPDAVLLGERQLRFLRDWATDWSGDTWMKVALSQTLFTNLATIPHDAKSGSVLPSLKTPEPGEYPIGYKLATDTDSGGWPQTGRNNAIREFRRAFAIHLSGDQHLGSCVRYGVDNWDDASWAMCVPPIGNIWPRRWFPSEPGCNRVPGAPRYTGQFLDGFGNHVTVHAVANPVSTGHEPAALYDRVPGYGIVRFNRQTRDIVIEAWPRWVDPSKADAAQYFGWPIKINQLDNYGRPAAGYLPTIQVTGMQDPVFRVINQQDGEIIYALRIQGDSFRPKVFENGTYTIEVGEPGTPRWKTLKDLHSTMEQQAAVQVRF